VRQIFEKDLEFLKFLLICVAININAIQKMLDYTIKNVSYSIASNLYDRNSKLLDRVAKVADEVQDKVSIGVAPKIIDENQDQTSVLMTGDLIKPEPKHNFFNLIKDKFNQIKKSEEISGSDAKQGVNLVELTASLNEAEIAVQQIVQIRDKIVSGYKEILNSAF